MHGDVPEYFDHTRNIGIDLFPVRETADFLDYIDSNGDRHTQELAKHKFGDEESLIDSYLTYNVCPPDESEMDTVIGYVRSKPPIIGTKILGDPSRIVRVLERFVDARTRLNCEIDSYASMDGMQNIILSDRISGEPIVISVKLDGEALFFSFILESDHELPSSHRYRDIELASELWALLHEFASNIEQYMQPIENFKDDTSSFEHTLKVGQETTIEDTCRFGLAALKAVSEIVPINKNFPRFELASNIDYAKYDTESRNVSKELLNFIIGRALGITEVVLKSNTLSNEAIDGSFFFQAELDRIAEA